LAARQNEYYNIGTNMDVEQLHVVLQQSFSAEAAVRKPAEETIRNLKNLPGAVQMLLQVAAEKQVRFMLLFVPNLQQQGAFSALLVMKLG